MTDDEEDRRASQGVTPAGLGPWRTPPPPAGFEPFPPEAVDGSVSDRFLAVAERHGDRTALSAPAGSWTFTALRDEVLGRAGAIAAAVDDPRPQPVAILADHDGPLVATILAVIAAGHIVVVLDPIGPDDQLDHARRESGATLVVHDRRWAEAAAAMTDRAGTGLRTIGLDDLIATEDFTPPSRGHDDPLLLAFTSGTSGASKAAIVTHGVLLNLIRGATDALGIGPTDRMPMLFPTSLAVAAYPMFLPLLNGGTLATLDVRSVGLAPVADFLATERITLAYMAPTVVRFLTDALAGRSFPDLRMIALGGELVDAEVVRLTVDLFDPTHVANGFGTTETGVITLHVLDAAGPTVDGAVPAGHPVPDVELVILDDHGQVLPIGGSGEVAIVSPHVFAGYWGHPELNAQVLEPDPSGRPGWIRYRTGDLGRLDDHGVLTVLGRLDTNVKVRGRFVVLGDVEAALHELDEVADAAVVARERDGVTELCGAVTPSAASGPLEGPTLRAALLASQEAYRVPSRWEVLDELPRLPNGKVDRQALAALFDLDPEPVSLVEEAFDRHDEPARREVVEELRPLWELLLPVERVGVDDDFFHLGGDSLVAAQMLVMAEQRLGITVPMGELVHARTLAQLTDVILRIRRGGELTPALVSCVQAGDEASPAPPLVRPRPPGLGVPRPVMWPPPSARTNRSGASNRRCCGASPTRSRRSTPSPPATSATCVLRSPRVRTGWPATPSAAFAPTRWLASSSATARRPPSWASSTSAPATAARAGATATRRCGPGSAWPSRRRPMPRSATRPATTRR